VQVHTYDAEMGRTGGGVFNTTLKTGSNDFHGTGFFQTRPIWAEKKNFFSQKEGIPKPNNPYYLFGGGVGGALIQKKHLFWFGWLVRIITTGRRETSALYFRQQPNVPATFPL